MIRWCVRRFATAAFVVSLIAQNCFAAEIHLTWNPNPETDLAGYKVYATDLTTSARTSFDVGLQTEASFAPETGKSYSFTVTAYNFAGLESGPSQEVRYERVDALFVSWDASVYNSVVSYRLSYAVLNQTAQEVSAGAQTSIQIDGLQRGNTYYFYVEAFDANGQKVDAWQQVTAVLPSSGDLGGVHIPRMNASPQVLLTSPSANASFTAPATITLSATASDPDGVIQAVEFYSGSTRLASDSAAPYTFVWSSVAAGTYQLSAVALDSNGASARANVAITVKAAAPAAPTSLSGSAMETTVQLTWLHAGTDESGFRVYRSTGADYALVSTLAANSTEFTNTGLTPGVSYSYRVTAFNSGGESVPAQVSVTTRIHPPEAPSGIVASPVNEAIVIGWNASERATAYIVERSTTLSGPFAKIGTTQITQWTDSSVTPDTAYYYRVVASENGVLSAPSAIVSSLLPGSAPIAPTNLTSSVVKGGVTILWRDRSSNETGFQVERSLDGESFTLIATVEANVVTYTDNTVAPRRKYYYRVGAVNAAGTRFSSTMNVRTR